MLFAVCVFQRKNCLPVHICDAQSLPAVKCHRKTQLFQLAYSTFSLATDSPTRLPRLLATQPTTRPDSLIDFVAI